MTEKQKRFVAEYLRQPNGTQAAIRAGYGEKNAASAASRVVPRFLIVPEQSLGDVF